MLTDIVFRLRAIFRRRNAERDLADELRFALDHAVAKHMAAGMSRREATRRANIAFGGIEQTKESYRDAQGVALVDATLQDVRYGVRTIRRSPIFSATAIATIALSTASIATVASLANTLIWRRLPVARADEIVSVTPTRGPRAVDGNISYPDYAAFRDRTTTLAGLAAHYSTAPLFITANGNAKESNGAVVSANYFPLLGIEPEGGRFFHADEDRVPDRDRVAVIGHDFWRTWLAASPKAVGTSITINGVAFTVIGIAPAGVPALTPLPVDVYIPTMMLRAGYRWCDDSLAAGCTALQMIGRLAPGRTVRDANAEFATLVPLAWRNASASENSRVVVRQPRGMSEDDREPRLVATLAAVAIVLLLICCANLAGLLSAQAAARGTEFAIRVSLGADRLRIIRQVVTESLLLAGAGGIGGLLLSRGFVGALSAMFYSLDDEGHPLHYDFSQTTTVVAATVGAALLAGVAFSLIPAINAVRHPRRSSARTITTRWSAGKWLLSAQAAVAVAMVATAALLTASAHNVLVGRNYETSHIALMRVRPRLLKYAPDRAQQFQREVVRRLRTVPSVESVTMVGIGSILGGGLAKVTLPAATDERITVRYNEIGPEYFSTLRTPMIAGREFDERDTLRSPGVAVVNETLAARLWPRGRALGAMVLVGSSPRQVVGVVADVSIQARDAAADAWVYVPFWQNPGQIDSRIAVRVSGDPAAILPALTREVHAVDADVPIAETITLPTRMAGLTAPVRVGAAFVGYAASFAMLLTAIGLYGALAFAVSRRTKEIGIRLALGAARSRLVASIVREGFVVVCVGAAAGVLLAVAQSRVVAHLLYGSATPDWLIYAASAILIVIVGVTASLVPAGRAAAVEPIAALRQD